ncbi:MAG: L-serine ammonia-lyase, iron-sulfur-dependent subunit beta [Bacillota bacterium]|jgi:L-serine dehydratase
MSTRRRLQVFDVIGPVMIGPSSSHTAGTARLGKLARQLLGEEPRQAVFKLYGSLAATYRGHGSDLALLGGVLGFSPDDDRIVQAREHARQAGLRYSFQTVAAANDLLHPNTVGIHLAGPTRQVEMTGASVGGGKVEVLELDGFSVSLKGEEHTLVINSVDKPGVITGISGLLTQAGVNIGNMAVSRAGKGQAVVMSIEVDGILSPAILESLRSIAGVNRIVWLERI